MDTLYEITINAASPETSQAFERWHKANEEFANAKKALKEAVEKSEPVRTTKRTTPYTVIGEIVPGGNPSYPVINVTMRASVKKSEPPSQTAYDPYKGVQFRNLNDLNAAKFLTDEEKRRILGLPIVEGKTSELSASSAAPESA